MSMWYLVFKVNKNTVKSDTSIGLRLKRYKFFLDINSKIYLMLHLLVLHVDRCCACIIKEMENMLNYAALSEEKLYN
jgi:hypothetical protein